MGDCQEPTGALAFSTSSLLSSTVEIISQTRLLEGFQPQSLSFFLPGPDPSSLDLEFTQGCSLHCVKKGAQVWQDLSLSPPCLFPQEEGGTWTKRQHIPMGVIIVSQGGIEVEVLKFHHLYPFHCHLHSGTLKN